MEDPRVQARVGDSSLILHHANIGPTGEWGTPLGEITVGMGLRYALEPLLLLDAASRRAIDLVLVDGRFRVACVLATVLPAPNFQPGSFPQSRPCSKV